MIRVAALIVPVVIAVFSAASLVAAQSLPALDGAAKKPSLQERAEKAVKARLVLDRTALVPGEGAMLGITFDIVKDWHLYWRNAGDSGLPISWEFDAPEGVTIGEAQWPVAQRKIEAGDILDYVYEGRVTLLFPVRVARDVAATATVMIKARVDWLVCAEACVAGGAALALAAPVGTTGEASVDAELFDASRARLPVAAGSGVSAKFESGKLILGAAGADEMCFYPYEGDIQPRDALEHGRVRGVAMTLTYGDIKPGTPVRGVLEVRTAGGTIFHLIDVPVGPARQ